MSQFDGVLLVNQSLLAIGRSEISVEALQDDIFELDLTSIDRLMHGVNRDQEEHRKEVFAAEV